MSLSVHLVLYSIQGGIPLRLHSSLFLSLFYFQLYSRSIACTFTVTFGPKHVLRANGLTTRPTRTPYIMLKYYYYIFQDKNSRRRNAGASCQKIMNRKMKNFLFAFAIFTATISFQFVYSNIQLETSFLPIRYFFCLGSFSFLRLSACVLFQFTERNVSFLKINFRFRCSPDKKVFSDWNCEERNRWTGILINRYINKSFYHLSYLQI